MHWVCHSTKNYFHQQQSPLSTMKKILHINLLPSSWAWLGLILFFTFPIVKAQAQVNPKQEKLKQVKYKKYRAIITLANGERVKGSLESVSDSSIELHLDSKYYQKKVGSQIQKGVVLYNNLRLVKVRRPNAILIGAATGAGTGLLIGTLDWEDSPPCSPGSLLCGIEEAMSAVRMLIYTVAGTGLGATIGVGTLKQFKINGLYSNFESFKNKMILKGY
jgi:hypothetical protein